MESSGVVVYRQVDASRRRMMRNGRVERHCEPGNIGAKTDAQFEAMRIGSPRIEQHCLRKKSPLAEGRITEARPLTEAKRGKSKMKC